MVIKVLLVDDNALFRDGVARILHRDGRFDVVGQASTGAGGVTAAAELHPDLVLLDLRMPGPPAQETIAALLSHNPGVAIGILSIFESDENVRPALAAGARGYIPKDATTRELCDAAIALVGGRAAHLVPQRRTEVDAGPVASLTSRELEVLRALAFGGTYAMIARDLGISPKTLRNHISNTYKKLEVFDRAQAVIVAVRAGIVDTSQNPSVRAPKAE